MVDNVTSIASAVNERVIGSRHENLGTTPLLVVFPSFYRKILIQPTGIYIMYHYGGADTLGYRGIATYKYVVYKIRRVVEMCHGAYLCWTSVYL